MYLDGKETNQRENVPEKKYVSFLRLILLFCRSFASVTRQKKNGEEGGGDMNKIKKEFLYSCSVEENNWTQLGGKKPQNLRALKVDSLIPFIV